MCWGLKCGGTRSIVGTTAAFAGFGSGARSKRVCYWSREITQTELADMRLRRRESSSVVELETNSSRVTVVVCKPGSCHTSAEVRAG